MDPKREAIKREENDPKFEQRVLNIDRVARVVKGGRRFRFRALVALGDHQGQVGIGLAKGADVTSAISKAADVAKRNLRTVVIEKETIPHEVRAKVSGAQIMLKPARAGRGMIAGNVCRQVLEIAGYANIVGKSLGSSNKTNVAYAVLAALEQLVPKQQWLTTKKEQDESPSTKG